LLGAANAAVGDTRADEFGVNDITSLNIGVESGADPIAGESVDIDPGLAGSASVVDTNRAGFGPGSEIEFPDGEIDLGLEVAAELARIVGEVEVDAHPEPTPILETEINPLGIDTESDDVRAASVHELEAEVVIEPIDTVHSEENTSPELSSAPELSCANTSLDTALEVAPESHSDGTETTRELGVALGESSIEISDDIAKREDRFVSREDPELSHSSTSADGVTATAIIRDVGVVAQSSVTPSSKVDGETRADVPLVDLDSHYGDAIDVVLDVGESPISPVAKSELGSEPISEPNAGADADAGDPRGATKEADVAVSVSEGIAYLDSNSTLGTAEDPEVKLGPVGRDLIDEGETVESVESVEPEDLSAKQDKNSQADKLLANAEVALPDDDQTLDQSIAELSESIAGELTLDASLAIMPGGQPLPDSTLDLESLRVDEFVEPTVLAPRHSIDSGASSSESSLSHQGSEQPLADVRVYSSAPVAVDDPQVVVTESTDVVLRDSEVWPVSAAARPLGFVRRVVTRVVKFVKSVSARFARWMRR
jgi:hypothetical protein